MVGSTPLARLGASGRQGWRRSMIRTRKKLSMWSALPPYLGGKRRLVPSHLPGDRPDRRRAGGGAT